MVFDFEKKLMNKDKRKILCFVNLLLRFFFFFKLIKKKVIKILIFCKYIMLLI